MRQRPRQSRRPSNALRTAAAMAAAVPVLALVPAAQAADGSPDPGQPDLVVSELQATALKPGEVRRDTVTLTNRGTAPAEKILFRIRLTRGLAFPESAPGCVYSSTHDHEHQALCRLDGTLQPGASTTVPVPIKVLSKALWEAVDYGTGATGGEPGDGYSESYRETRLKADNTADFAATGDRAWGWPGRTVHVRVSLRNEGPGWVRVNDSDDQSALMVTIPPGTVAVRVPSDCVPFGIDGPSGPTQPGKPRYVCFPPDYTYEVGSVHSYTFTLRIKKGAHTTSGEAKATSVYDIHPDFDHNAANDKAPITVWVPGHGQGAGSGSGSGTGSGASTPPATAARSGASGTHASGADTAPGARTDGGAKTSLATGSDDTDLASTGTGTAPYAAAGALVAVGLGGLAFLAARRRRRNGAS